jgi:hypothetical protein
VVVNPLRGFTSGYKRGVCACANSRSKTAKQFCDALGVGDLPLSNRVAV